MKMPKRIRRQSGRYALVDRIPFQLPIDSEDTPALVAAFPINAVKAKKLLPGNELHPARIFGKGVLLVTVVNYPFTDIGRYIEYIIAIACTHGPKPAPSLLPFVFRWYYRLGGYLYDMPVSTEISVKGGKGIWGMPKHQANLDFKVTESVISSQYDLEGMLAMRIEMQRPKSTWLPVSMTTNIYSQFRGMLMKAYSYFGGRAGFSVLSGRACRLYIGNHPRIRPLKELGIGPRPFFMAFFPSTRGIIDDHFEGWFLSYEEPPSTPPEGLESVVDLGLSQEWLDPPTSPLPSEAVEDREGSLRT
jgi:Acetoacetate decarboxylase (ADC)